MENNCYWPYVSNLGGSFSKAFEKENLLGSKRKANNNYFPFIPFRSFRSISSLQQLILYLVWLNNVTVDFDLVLLLSSFNLSMLFMVTCQCTRIKEIKISADIIVFLVKIMCLIYTYNNQARHAFLPINLIYVK